MNTTPQTPVPSSPKTTVKAPTKRKLKRSNDKPRRALSAYNIFFALERKRIMSTTSPSPPLSARSRRRLGKHANVGFANLARIVGEKWRSIDEKTKRRMDELAREDRVRYEREMVEWKAGKSFGKNVKAEEAASLSLGAEDDDASPNEREAVASPKEVTSPIRVPAAPTCRDNFPPPPFKFDEAKDISEVPEDNVFCLPCTAHKRGSLMQLSDWDVGVPPQRSLMGPSEADYLPGFSRMQPNNAIGTPPYLAGPGGYPRRISCDTLESGYPMGMGGMMYPVMQPELGLGVAAPVMGSIPLSMMGSAYSPPLYMGMNVSPMNSGIGNRTSSPFLSMGTNMNPDGYVSPIESGATSPVSMDMLMNDDVFRGLYESRMRRRSGM